MITASTGDGVAVVGASLSNTISANSIYANGGLGIDLNNDDVTLNDTLDPDSGPNNRQNFPVISGATYWTANKFLDILVDLNSLANTKFHIELFINTFSDPSGYGEGEQLLTTVDVLTDEYGNAPQMGVGIIPYSPDPTGMYITATATRFDAMGNLTDTSEFSKAVQVVAGESGGGGPLGLTSGSNVLAIGADEDDAPVVHIVDARSGRTRYDLHAYPQSFTGGVRTAVADANGDGVPDIITAPGAGGNGTVLVFSGANGAVLHRLVPFPTFSGGLFVTAGDVNGDGKSDVIAGMDSGGAEVKVYSGASGALLRSFTAFGAGFSGGVRLATGDVNGDGRSDIIVAAGAGGLPLVQVFSGADNSILNSFLAFEATFTGGVSVAAGDFNGDGKADIVVGAGAGRAAEVKVFRGSDGAVLTSVLPYGSTFLGGVRVAARDVNGDGRVDLLVGKASGDRADALVFDGSSFTLLDHFLSRNPSLRRRGYWS